MQLLLIRHGLPERVDAGSTAGSRADPPLADLGVAQSKRVVDAIARHHVTRIVSSPQLRATQTAAPTAEALGLPVDIEPGIAEYDRDVPFYIPIEQAKTEFRDSYDRIKRGDLPEQVDAAEFTARVVEALAGVAAAADHADTVAAFAHGGVINIVLQSILGNEKPLAFPIDYCSVTRILFSRNGRRSVASVNETEHVWDLLPRNTNTR